MSKNNEMEIGLNVHKDKKYMEERLVVRFDTVGLPILANAMEEHNLLSCVYQNKTEVEQRKGGDRVKDELARIYIFEYRLRITNLSTSLLLFRTV